MLKRFHQTPLDRAMELFSSVKRAVYAGTGVSPEKFHYIMPVGSLGELVFTLSQTQHLRSKAKVCLLLKHEFAYLTALWPFSADFVVLLSPEEHDLLLAMEPVSYRYPGWLFTCWVEVVADGRFSMDLVLKNNRLSLKEIHSYALGLGLDAALQLPVLESEAGNKGDKPVLLMPDDGAPERLPPSFWAALALGLKRQGHTVYVAGEAPLQVPEGTVSHVEKSAPELLRFARSMELVIALRSGLADLVGAAIPGSGTKMIALHHVSAAFRGTPREFHHAPGVSHSGLNLARCFGTDQIRDVEICSDDAAALVNGELAKLIPA